MNQQEQEIDGPWVYRPHELDDWGIVRDANGAVVCQARNPEMSEPALDLHRESGTDPYEHRARLVAVAPEMFGALLLAREWLSGWASAERELETIERVIDKATGPQKRNDKCQDQ